MQPNSPSPMVRTYALDTGPRVALRLARRRDVDALGALFAGRGVEASDLDVLRLLSFDPGRRIVLAATAPLDGVETLVGVGAIDLHDDAEPDTLVVDERLTQGLGELLGSVLLARASARASA